MGEEVGAARFPGQLKFGVQELVPASNSAITYRFLSLGQLRLASRFVLLLQKVRG